MLVLSQVGREPRFVALGSVKTVVQSMFFFFFQAEDGIRDVAVTGVQTCVLPICLPRGSRPIARCRWRPGAILGGSKSWRTVPSILSPRGHGGNRRSCSAIRCCARGTGRGVGRASCRGRGGVSVVGGSFKKKKEEI